MLDAIHPVLDVRVDVEDLLAVLQREPAHGQQRAQRGHRVAVDHDDGRVGVRREQRPELFAVLVRLEHPPLVARELVGDEREHVAHVAVVGRLVVREVVIAESRHVAHPLPLVAGEVGDLQLVLAARVVGRVLVHRRQHLVLAHELPACRGTCPPWIDAAGAGPLPRRGRGLRGDVHRQVAQPAVGAHQVLEMRAPRPGQRDHVDGTVDPHVERVGMLGPVVLDQQPVRGSLGALPDERRLVQLPDVVVGRDLVEQEREAFGEVHRPEVVETGLRSRRVEDPVDAELERKLLGSLEPFALLDGARVVAHALDAQHLHGHGGSSEMSVLPAFAIHPPSTITRSPVWKRESSLMKYTPMPSKSSGVPIRPMGL